MAELVQTTAQQTANGAETVLVAQKASDGYINNVVGFGSSLLKGEAINGKELVQGGLTFALAAFIGGGFWARKRTLSGREPIMGFIL